jgi:serine palmitoyltransferase
MSPPVAQQIISSMNEIMDKENGDGMRRVRQLASNVKYFRAKLRELGCVIYGHEDSPVVPLMLFVPAKIPALVNGLLEHNVASIGVGFPATKMTEERARYCISAGHTKDHLDKAIEAIDKCADRLCLKYKAKL